MKNFAIKANLVLLSTLFDLTLGPTYLPSFWSTICSWGSSFETNYMFKIEAEQSVFKVSELAFKFLFKDAIFEPEEGLQMFSVLFSTERTCLVFISLVLLSKTVFSSLHIKGE